LTIEATSGSKSAADLRLEFDTAFASPPAGPSEDRESLITLRVGGEGLAVKTLHIAGIAKRRRITPIPTHVPSLLGATAIRGALFPVYDLAALLGLPAPAREGAWLMLSGLETPIALIFDEFEGQVEIERACLYESESSREQEHLRLVARIGSGHRAVIDIPGMIAEIRKTAGLLDPQRSNTK
jgi:chemotaxis signal transduction protein